MDRTEQNRTEQNRTEQNRTDFIVIAHQGTTKQRCGKINYSKIINNL